MADRPARRRSSLADEHPAYSGPSAVPTPAATASTSITDADTTSTSPAPLPPPRRRRTTRVQLNTRVRQDLHDRLQAFVDQHDAAVQDVVETALLEYFERRA